MLEDGEQLCFECESQLQEISGRRCDGCSRSLEKLAKQHVHGDRCGDCVRWNENEATNDLLEKNISLYSYNPFLKEWLATYKFRGDAIIAQFFSQKLSSVYKKEFSGYIPVEIPLSKERLYARGFNQSALLLQGWAKEAGLLTRQVGEKQSKRNRKERIAQVTNNPFKVHPGMDVAGKKIVLVDDIYTTGTTVRQVAKVLKEQGATSVASMTVAR
ncbi:ComF family protein [bacterium LRH843]|nr:ComF family protein [bacterium LRH843]